MFTPHSAVQVNHHDLREPAQRAIEHFSMSLDHMPHSQPDKFGFRRTLLGVLPLLILIGGVVLSIGIMVLTPKAERRPPPAGEPPTVDVMEIVPRAYQVIVESYGTVQPRTESRLVAQVTGLVTSISPSLRDGGFFEQGDTLLTIDDRDYAANVNIAAAALVDAQQALAEEQARSGQAKADWERLGNTEPAPDLVLRKPQLSAAEARVESAQSSLRKTKLDLERTVLKAPFAGRVFKKSIDVGQVASINSTIAEIYASDSLEVRLPLRDRDLPYVNLPERYRFTQDEPVQNDLVELQSSLVRDSIWLGSIVRTESAIDENARQLHCVAQIDDPFGKPAEGRTPLKIGEYVTAQIHGKTLKEAIVIPVSAIYQSTFTYVVSDDTLQQRNVEIAWQNDIDAIIASGLQPGEQLVLTPMGPVTSGLKVKIAAQEDRRKSGETGTQALNDNSKPAGAPR